MEPHPERGSLDPTSAAQLAVAELQNDIKEFRVDIVELLGDVQSLKRDVEELKSAREVQKRLNQQFMNNKETPTAKWRFPWW